MVLVIQGKAIELTTDDGKTVNQLEILELRSNQEETDSRVALYAEYGYRKGFKTVKVRSPDSDIFFILLHFSAKINSTLLFETGSGNKKRLINVTAIAQECGEKLCTALMSLHVFTGCDTTSAFRGIGKIKPIKLLQKKTVFEDCLVKLGENWSLDEKELSELEKFTCSLYGYPRYSNINTLRYDILMKKCDNDTKLDMKKSVDLSTLPPCSDTLIQHIKRVNLQLGVWRNALVSFQDIPTAAEHGWVMVDDLYEPNWCEKNILPVELVELLDDTMDVDSEEEDLDLACNSSFDSDFDEGF